METPGDPRGRSARLLLIRHGAVADEWRGRIYGCLDVPLSPEGEAEARGVAAGLRAERLACVVSSGLSRTEFGAAELRRGRALARTDDPELHEIDRGSWAGLTPEELDEREPGAWAAWHRAPDRLRPPGGESLADVAARVLPRLDAWSALHAGETVAIVAHRWVIRAAVCRARDLPLARATEIEVPTGVVIELPWSADGERS